MALEWTEAVERMDVYLKELLSSGLLLLHAELGVDVGLKAELLPPGLLACVAAGLGLVLALFLLFSVCRCFSKKTAERVAPEAGKSSRPKAEEVKKRSRKRGGEKEKKVQRNGQPVDLEEEPKPVENQNQSESPEPEGAKSEKGKKNKKKTKAPVKETTSERREPEEGTWETKVSQREKRQQRRKDKGAGDESGSPGGTEPCTNPEHEEPKSISPPSVTTKSSNISTTTNTKSSNTSTSSNITVTKSSNINTTTTSSNTTNTKSSNTSNPQTQNTKSSNTSTPQNAKSSNVSNPTNTKSSNTTTNTKSSPAPAPKAQKNSVRTPQLVAPVNPDLPVADVTHAVNPPVSHAWDVIGVNGSGSWDLGASVPPHSQTWNSVNTETSVWPQDMEGSWMIVDGSHIPVSLHGMSAGVPESSWVCPTPVDDEWSGPSNSVPADPRSDYCAPCEEWGNYEEPAGGAVSPPVEPQDSELEKEDDEPAAPGSSKAKRKKKKKKKAEETRGAAQVEVEVGGTKDQKAAGSPVLAKNMKEDKAPPPILLKPSEPQAPPRSTAPPTQKKPEENLEPQKPVKKKKARRET